MSNSNTPTLKCSSCEHENEPERVYCHNCGSKLDRSLLPKVEASKSETADETHQRVQRMMKPKRAGGFSDMKVGIQMVIFAILVAAIFLFWLKPEGVPDSSKGHIPVADPGDLWTRLMEVKTANSFTSTEEDINAHLARTLKAGEASMGIKFVRAVAAFKPGTVTVFVERSVFGLSTYSSVTYKITNRDGKVGAELIGLHLGRLGIHPSIAGSLENWAVTGLWKTLGKELKQADRLSEIRVAEGRITFVSKPL